MNTKIRRQISCALPWLIACVHASSWADPMRPLIPPGNAAALAGVDVSTAERSARPRLPEALREPERLVAIRQDSASRWQALFGERWVSAGDRLDHYTVGSIEGNSVQLADGRQRRILHLLPPLSGPGIAPDPSSTPTPTAAAPGAPPSNRAIGPLTP